MYPLNSFLGGPDHIWRSPKQKFIFLENVLCLFPSQELNNLENKNGEPPGTSLIGENVKFSFLLLVISQYEIVTKDWENSVHLCLKAFDCAKTMIHIVLGTENKHS